VLISLTLVKNKMSCAPIGTGLISLSVHDEGNVTGIRQDEFRIGAEAMDLLVKKLQRWETGSPRGPRLQLVRGVWCAGLSATGAGLSRQALLPEKQVSSTAFTLAEPHPRPPCTAPALQNFLHIHGPPRSSLPVPLPFNSTPCPCSVIYSLPCSSPSAD
jgi:hypothetical protein